ncbi:MAG: DUF4296 domain-containing protein, partial [Paludibacter sp.]
MLHQLTKMNLRFVFICIVFLGMSACNGRPKGVLNESEMTDVLTEMHRLDGTMAAKGLQYGNYQEKAQYYSFILKKYDISQAQFDSSLVWYTKNPKTFDVIYDNVLARLTDFEKEVKRGKYHPVDSVEMAKIKVNLWNKKSQYTFKKDSARTHLDFEILNSDLLFGDVYTLKFLQRISPEDSCIKQHVMLRINYFNGKKDIAFAVSHNDSLLRRYSLRLPAMKRLKIKSISGELLGSKTYKGKFNCTLDSIVLMRVYNSRLQDSLRKVVKKADPKDYSIPLKLKTD